MVSWHTVVANDILPVVAGDCFWEDHLRELINNDTSPAGLHLAVFVEPYLGYILEGKKTVESRFGMRRSAPYGQVAAGDSTQGVQRPYSWALSGFKRLVLQLKSKFLATPAQRICRSTLRSRSRFLESTGRSFVCHSDAN